MPRQQVPMLQQLLLESFYSFKNIHKKTFFKNENDMWQ